MAEREPATLEVGSSNLLAHFVCGFSTSGRVDSGAWLQPTLDRFDSGGVLKRFAGVAELADARSLNLRKTLRVRLPPSAFTAGIEQGWLDGLISHDRQVQLLPPLSRYLKLWGVGQEVKPQLFQS